MLLEKNESENLSSLVTFDLDNKCTWTKKFSHFILGFEIIDSIKKAAILIQQAEDESIILSDLLSGTYSKSLEVGKGWGRQV